MSGSDRTMIIERVARLFDSRRELVRWFLANASAKHGTPYVPEDVVVDERTAQASIERRTTTEQSAVVNRLWSTVRRWGVPLLTAGAIGGGGYALYNYFSQSSSVSTPAQSRDNSLFQYLEDKGFHRPNE